VFDAIFFDLDGTLLPMDYACFTKGYLSLLAKAVSPLGYRAETMIPAMWKGVEAMMRNDGIETNYRRFWTSFFAVLGEEHYEHVASFDAFYEQEFHRAIAFTSPAPDSARQAVALARQKAGRVVLATNPLFPRVAVSARLDWAGLSENDFDYVTDYESSSYCKPNPAYFTEIARTLGVDPKRCLMIGNHTEEDIQAAQAAGLSTFLLTDCLISEGATPDTPKGSFEDLLRFLQAN
jgi:HAD superfamily hydrolase (TIGR01549 family)